MQARSQLRHSPAVFTFQYDVDLHYYHGNRPRSRALEAIFLRQRPLQLVTLWPAPVQDAKKQASQMELKIMTSIAATSWFANPQKG